ncbi:hypothetical protein M0R45_013248 [Rubus argutus]|uniref:Dof zinc finger protein n=1 Tax=Rubus argutus TaxID=59490 RepID=A0AAW1XK10_RUBAR
MLMDQQKMVLISSTTNDWSQIDDDDDQNHKGVMGSTAAVGASRLMEKPGQEQLQQQQQALKCPRCDSSNTKFCYYNNYSLSQPRHFCKACKRYWTRGGTLRNVPVGGGCRKNKRVKRPSSNSTVENGASSSASSAPNSGNSNLNTNTQQQNHHQIDLASNSNHHMNPLFYGLGSNPSDHIGLNQFTASGFDQFSALGLGFGDQRFNPAATSKQIQDLVAANSLHSSNHSIFNSTSYSTAPTMASVLASKFINGGFKDVRGNNNQYFQTLLPFEDLQIAAAGSEAVKGVKVEDGRQNRVEWSTNHQTSTEQMGLSSDPTLYWSSSNLGANNWHDPANLGSSVSSLI